MDDFIFSLRAAGANEAVVTWLRGKIAEQSGPNINFPHSRILDWGDSLGRDDHEIVRQVVGNFVVAIDLIVPEDDGQEDGAPPPFRTLCFCPQQTDTHVAFLEDAARQQTDWLAKQILLLRLALLERMPMWRRRLTTPRNETKRPFPHLMVASGEGDIYVELLRLEATDAEIARFWVQLTAAAPGHVHPEKLAAQVLSRHSWPLRGYRWDGDKVVVSSSFRTKDGQYDWADTFRVSVNAHRQRTLEALFPRRS